MGSAHSKYVGLLPVEPSRQYAGLLPIEPQDHFLCPIDLRPQPIDLKPQLIDLKAEDVQFPNWERSARKGPRILARFAIAFCTGVAAAWLWQSYGDAAREMIANSHWLFAPRPALTVQNPHPPDVIALAAPADPASADLDAAGQSDKIGTIPATATSVDQAPAARASGVTVESQGDAAPLEPAARLIEARPAQTLAEKGKPLAARPKGSDHRRDGTTVAAPLAPLPQGWSFGLP